MVKRYYSLFYRIYHIITAELLDISKDIVLQMAFKIINNSIGPDSLISILLVFRAYLCIIEFNIFNPTVLQYCNKVD
jgi:hypothetical protein